MSAADAIEIAAKVATMPNTSADDASNFFMGAAPVGTFSKSWTARNFEDEPALRLFPGGLPIALDWTAAVLALIRPFHGFI